uniref:NADH-ubiquinone oxidoreductase chain 6 n=1 Tax=Linuparus trigonus TaxID=198218 RepID=A0A7D3Q7X6_9EUCA|nr:NADH dehydrogenase subunit 6 [Linuparus trigonus]QKE42643.1 NADH dehydrogenase subunit 6 [Linuparus trigonus]
MLMTFFPLIFFMSLLFTRLVHPLSAGMVLLIQTILVSLTTGLVAPSFWFSYILFLIFLGGMLVLFIYVASLASNESFSVSLISGCAILFSSILMALILATMDPFFSPWPITPQHNFFSMFTQPTFTSSLTCLIYNQPTLLLTSFVILYLLLTLIVVVFVTSIFFGPLRFSK